MPVFSLCVCGGGAGGTLKVALRFKHVEKKELLLLFCTSKILSQDLFGSQLCSATDLRLELFLSSDWEIGKVLSLL